MAKMQSVRCHYSVIHPQPKKDENELILLRFKYYLQTVYSKSSSSKTASRKNAMYGFSLSDHDVMHITASYYLHQIVARQPVEMIQLQNDYYSDFFPAYPLSESNYFIALCEPIFEKCLKFCYTQINWSYDCRLYLFLPHSSCTD